MIARNVIYSHVLALSLIAAAAPPALAQPRPRDTTDTKSNETIKGVVGDLSREVRKSTVQIRCDGQIAALGTVVDPQGFILTKASELNGKIEVRFWDGRQLSGKVVGVESGSDLAMIKVDAHDLTAVTFDVKSRMSVGDLVMASDYSAEPVGLGVISVGKRPIPSGNGFIGIGLDELPNGGGIKITQVMPKSAAEAAGLHVDDVITELDGVATPDSEDLQFALRPKGPGEVISITYTREGKAMHATIKLGERSATTRPIGRGGGRGGSRLTMQNNLGRHLSRRAVGFASVLQHDIAMDASQCGGPLINIDGKVIGINIAAAGRVETYALPSEIVVPLLADLKAGKYPTSTRPTTSEANEPLPQLPMGNPQNQPDENPPDEP